MSRSLITASQGPSRGNRVPKLCQLIGRFPALVCLGLLARIGDCFQEGSVKRTVFVGRCSGLVFSPFSRSVPEKEAHRLHFWSDDYWIAYEWPYAGS